MATEILRANAAGGYNENKNESNISGVLNYQSIDEVIADENTTFLVTVAYNTFLRDLHNLPASSGSDAINFIRVYVRTRSNRNLSGSFIKMSLKVGTTISDGSEVLLSNSYENYFNQWNTNPDTGSTWTWSNINALQIGFAQKGTDYLVSRPYTTQVWVEIDSGGWSGGDVNDVGIATMAKINEVALSDIIRVNGVD